MLGDIGRIQQEIRSDVGHVRVVRAAWLVGKQGCRRNRHPMLSCVRSLSVSGYASPGPLQAMSSSFVYVVQSWIVRPSGHVGGRLGSAAAVSFALPASSSLLHSSGVTCTVVSAGV